MERDPSKGVRVLDYLYSASYYDLECQVLSPEAILAMGDDTHQIFHKERFKNGNIRQIQLSKVRLTDDNERPRDAFRGEILIEDTGVGKQGNFERLLISLSHEVNEGDMLYEGLEIQRSGERDIFYASTQDGGQYTIHPRKSSKSKEVSVIFGNISVEKMGEDGISDYVPSQDVDPSDNLDGFLKLFMHVLSSSAEIYKETKKFNRRSLVIGQPVAPSEDVFVDSIRDHFDGDYDIEAENIYTLPGIDKSTRANLLRIAGVEGAGKIDSPDYSHSVILTGEGMDRASDIVSAFATSLGAKYVRVYGSDLRGKSSLETALKTDLVFDEITQDEGPAVLLIEELESAYRHYSGKATGIKALKQVFDYNLYYKNNLYIFATMLYPEKLPKILKGNDMFLTEIKLPGLLAKTRAEIIAAEIAKYAVLDMLSSTPPSFCVSDGLDIDRLGRAAGGLDNYSLRGIILDLYNSAPTPESPAYFVKGSEGSNFMQGQFEAAFKAYRKDNGL